MNKPIHLELYEREVNFLLIGLQLLSLNLNSIWSVKKEEDTKELDYCNIFMLYEYLSTKTSYYNSIRLEKPKKNLLQFKK